MKTAMTADQLVDSVLRPSNKIDKYFAQVNVITVKGKQIIGLLVSEDDKEIVLRDPAAPDLIKIAKVDVDEVITSKLSVMPSGLAKQLKSRADFDDLIKYIIETRKR